ncbi:hypothetical protein [Nocardioides sp. 1609]|uniref:hypothetical protein n=1 Tax=Nocardioides sp. 1609 TaxID=2508327 RepID=UPI0010704696|nr:hypothetical protein [Nocardioides sp. 1609]
MRPAPPAIDPADPFDLPEVLGTAVVTWSADDGLDGHLVRGHLQPDGGDPVACDLLAVDQAYPAAVADDATRLRTHQAWQHGQVGLATCGGRLTILVPGRTFTAETVLESVRRLAKALGASPSRYAVRLRVGP